MALEEFRTHDGLKKLSKALLRRHNTFEEKLRIGVIYDDWDS